MFDFNFDWSSDFNTNIKIIDTHHKQFFKIGRDIEQLLQKKCIGVKDKQLLDIICDLREFAGYHFYEEERIMEENNYPDREAHRKEHDIFSSSISKINMQKLKESPEVELMKIRDHLQEKFFSHILVDDRKMAEYIKNIKKVPVTENIVQLAVKDEYETLYGMKISDLDVTRAYLFHEQSHKGRVVLVCKDKIKEMGRLSVLERNMFFSDVARVAKAVQKLYSPQAFNYASFGDVDSQLNIHIVPKYKDQFEWGQPFSINPDKIYLEQAEYETMAEEIRRELK